MTIADNAQYKGSAKKQNRPEMGARIYTKTGDKGETSLLGGERVPKSHLRIEAYGTVDELNCFVGILRDTLEDPEAGSLLEKIQECLFCIGSGLAAAKPLKMALPEIGEADVRLLEASIDRMEQALPPLRSFILPGGHPQVSFAHMARAVCRRAERCCVRMLEEQMPVDPTVVRYLNRLSDYLFVLARFTAHRLQVEERTWQPGVSTRPR